MWAFSLRGGGSNVYSFWVTCTDLGLHTHFLNSKYDPYARWIGLLLATVGCRGRIRATAGMVVLDEETRPASIFYPHILNWVFAHEGPGRWVTSISCRDLPSPSPGVMLRIVDLARPKALSARRCRYEPYLGSILSFGKRTRVRSFE